jgi:hypothetical protein
MQFVSSHPWARGTVRIAAGLILTILVAACAPKSTAPILNVEKDTVYSDWDAIGIVEVKMVDKTYSLDSYMPHLVVDRQVPLFLVDENLQPLKWMMWHYWKTEGNANHFSAVCLMRIKPGTYGISSLVLQKDRSSSFEASHLVNVPVNRQWQVPSDRLAYLGEMRVEFTKRKIASDGHATYRQHLSFSHDEAHCLQLMNRFKQVYPRIFGHYENKLQILQPRSVPGPSGN